MEAEHETDAGEQSEPVPVGDREVEPALGDRLLAPEVRAQPRDQRGDADRGDRHRDAPDAPSQSALAWRQGGARDQDEQVREQAPVLDEGASGGVGPRGGGERPDAEERQTRDRDARPWSHAGERPLHGDHAKRERHRRHERDHRPRLGVEAARLEGEHGDAGARDEGRQDGERAPDPAHSLRS